MRLSFILISVGLLWLGASSDWLLGPDAMRRCRRRPGGQRSPHWRMPFVTFSRSHELWPFVRRVAGLGRLRYCLRRVPTHGTLTGASSLRIGFKCLFIIVIVGISVITIIANISLHFLLVTYRVIANISLQFLLVTCRRWWSDFKTPYYCHFMSFLGDRQIPSSLHGRERTLIKPSSRSSGAGRRAEDAQVASRLGKFTSARSVFFSKVIAAAAAAAAAWATWPQDTPPCSFETKPLGWKYSARIFEFFWGLRSRLVSYMHTYFFSSVNHACTKLNNMQFNYR